MDSTTKTPCDGTIPQDLTAAFARHRGRVALRGGDRSLTYGELAGVAAATGAVLPTGGTVGLYGVPGVPFAAAAVGCVVAGRPFVHLDPAMPEAVLDNIVAELALEVVIAAEPVCDGRLSGCRVVDAVSLLGVAGESEVAAAAVAPGDPIYVVATSGTTGRPKCIPVTQDAAALSYRWRETLAPYGPGMTVACYIFAIWEMFRPLRHGATVVFPGARDLFSPAALSGFLRANRVDEMLFTPSFLAKILAGLAPGADLPLGRVILNGEVVGDDLAEAVRLKVPGAEVWNLYSICETHDVSMVRVTGGAASVGRAMPYVTPVVLGEDDGPVAPGDVGRLHFAGPRMLGPGYMGRPEETARRFRSVEIGGRGQRLYDTGDLGRVSASGEIEVLGRAAHMLKLRGHSIQTPELVEAMAAHLDFGQAIPWVQSAGGGDQALVVYYTADDTQVQSNRDRWGMEPGRSALAEGLGAALRAVLPGYCVPSHLVRLDAIPIHPVSGKCDYAALPPITAEAAPEGDVPPAIRQAARLLKRRPGDLLPGRSFRDQGGDSLMSMDLILSLEADYGRPVDFDWALGLPLGRLHELLSRPGGWSAGVAFDRPGILVTGATGFLGGHVLAAAAETLPEGEVIYCLVRPGRRDPAERLGAAALAAGVPPGRVVPVAGAMDADRFGLDAADYDALSARVRRVIHCAATVNLALERSAMEAWSIAATDVVLEFCRAAGADLRFTSSSAVFPERGGPHPEAPARPFDGITGYGAAKIAAEARIAASGIDAAIVRLPSLYDLAAPNESDLYEAILSASGRIGALPEGLTFPMVDVRAAAAFLARVRVGQGVAVHNLVGDRRVSCPDGAACLARQDWIAAAPLAPAMLTLISASPDILCADAVYRTASAEAAWAGADLGPMDRLCDPGRLLAARLSYQSEPAFT